MRVFLVAAIPAVQRDRAVPAVPGATLHGVAGALAGGDPPYPVPWQHVHHPRRHQDETLRRHEEIQEVLQDQVPLQQQQTEGHVR